MSTARIITMAAIAMAAFMLIASEPAEGPNYIGVFIITKSVGFGLAALGWVLYRAWWNDPLVSKLRRWLDTF